MERSSTPPERRQINSLQNYQQHSRLHFIGQWKTKMKDYLASCFEENPSWNHGQLAEQLTFIHMDLDAFFCSVQLAKPEYAHLRDRPVGVAAGHGNSDISSCNYVARSFGVHAGMYVNAAKERCPDLVTIGYDFVSCERIIKTLYRIIFDNFPAQFKMAMEVYSVDDVMLATDTEDLDALRDFCDRVRSELKSATGCTVSCGVGPNVLLSRLVTSLAKPDGVYILRRSDVRHFISERPFSDIHGAGHSTVGKVQQMLVQRGRIRDATIGRNKKGIARREILCADVQRLSKEDLQQLLGKKAGENFYRLCRGEDDRMVVRTGDPAQEEALRKRPVNSVGCSMNYAVRPASADDVWKIIGEVLQDVCVKLRRHGVATGSLRLTVLERHPLHPKTTQKFLGRGKCIEVHFPILFSCPLDHSKADVMMEAIKETLGPLLVLRRDGAESPELDTERAKMLGVDGEYAAQTIWTVSLPSVPDLLIEDIRGITVQANKLLPKTTVEAMDTKSGKLKRPRDAQGLQQRTLADLLHRNAAERRVETVIHTQTAGPRLSAASSIGSTSPQRVGLFTQKQEVGAYADFSSLLMLELDDPEFIPAWTAVCRAACDARDYFIIRACLRCAALKTLERAYSMDTSLSLQEFVRGKMNFFEQFVVRILGCAIDYQ
eukprot:gene4907-3519_t